MYPDHDRIGLPLCPELYDRLCRVFGDVAIANEGEEMVCRFERSVSAPGDADLDMVVDQPGEYYRVRCPYCSDNPRKKRLWINHRWAEYPHLAYCFNADCMSHLGHREDLRMRVLSRVRPIEYDVLPGTRESSHLTAVSPPGLCYPLTGLPPGHDAIQYLESRGYDPVRLAIDYGVGYCETAEDPRHRLMDGRIYCPVIMRGELVGWQGRYPADLNWKKARLPKYFTRPGFAKRLALYNHDRALDYPLVVVREGVTDVWSTGPYSVALLGKTITMPQKALLINGWATRGGVLVLGLDGGVPVRVEDPPWDELWRAFDRRVVVTQLPDDVDPGLLTPEMNWDVISAAARAAGIPIPFSPSFE